MNRIEIIVTAPTGSGKSIIVAAIDRALKEVGANVLAEDLEQERRLNQPDNPQDWELEAFRKSSYVVLKEINLSR